jgi:PAS domain S-box-containing protein
MIIIDLLYNLSVLVALSVFSGFIDLRFKRTELIGKLFQGMLFGLTAIIGMLYPFILTEGVIFDGRSIVISLCTLFFGPISGGVSALFAIIFRVYLGGAGVVMGVLVTVSSFLIGYIFYLRKNRQPEKPLTNLRLYSLGLFVHISMLVLILSLPSKLILETYTALTFSIIGVYPFVTVLIGKILLDQEENQKFVKQIKESEEKYRLLVDNQTDLIVKTNIEGKFLFVNPAYCELFGLSEQELIGKNYAPLVHDEDMPVVKEAVARLFKPPYYCSYEERAKTKFGWRWIQWEAKSVLDEKGKVIELIGSGRDITLKKETENALNKRLEFEKTLAAISTRFINLDFQQIDNEINHALASIGNIASVDRIYLFQLTENELYYSNTHEWCNEGILPQIQNLQLVPIDMIPWWTEKIKRFENIYIPNVRELPDKAKSEREMLELQDIKSLIAIPMVIGDKLTGFLGFDSVKKEKLWAEEDILLLKMLGEILSGALNRMKSKEALNKILAKQSAMLIAIPDLIFTVTREGILIDFNAPDPGLLLVPTEEFLNKQISSFLTQEIADEFLSLIEKTLSKKELNQLEYSLDIKGNVKHFEARIAPAGYDTTVVIIRDITQKNRVDQELIKLKRAIEQSSISVIITNHNGNIEYVNPFFTELTGFTPEEIMGKNPRILKSGYHSKEFYDQLWKDILSGKDWQGEILNKRKNGETYWEFTVISPILNKNGQITHFVAIQEDISQQKKMLEDLISAKNKAEEMNKIKSLFFANMSHELRTPMIGILGNAELLEMDVSDEQHKAMIHTIYKSALRLNETLNSILDISKIEVEGIQKVLKPVEVNLIIEESIKLFDAPAKDKGLTLNFVKKKNIILIETDDNFLTKILNNLINNAIKYSDSGTITVTSDYNNKKVIIEVEDNGIGIAPENLNIIFEPFRQTSEGYSRRYEGTGLGLTITKRFVDILGGTINVKSTIGKGSTFTVELPDDFSSLVFPQNPVEPINNILESTKQEHSARLLLVEDENINAEVIIKLLSDTYKTDWVQFGRDAILKVSENSYDAILMDIGLRGDLDGLEATRQIRKFDHCKNIPIVAVTAYAMEGDREKFLQNGCTHYLAKPFHKSELIRVIESALNR